MMIDAFKRLFRYTIQSAPSEYEGVVQALAQQAKFQYPGDLQLTAYGWEEAHAGELFLSLSGSLMGCFAVAARETPSAVVTAHLEERMRELNAQGIMLSKKEKKQLQHEIAQELRLEVPPTTYRCHIVLDWSRHEVWLLCDTKKAVDVATPLLVKALSGAGLKIAKAESGDAPSMLRSVFLSRGGEEGGSLRPMEASLLSSCGSVLRIKSVDDTPFSQRMQWINGGYKIASMTATYDDLIEFGLNSTGELTKFSACESLKGQLYELADPVNPELINPTWASLLVSSIRSALTVLDAHETEADVAKRA